MRAFVRAYVRTCERAGIYPSQRCLVYRFGGRPTIVSSSFTESTALLLSSQHLPPNHNFKVTKFYLFISNPNIPPTHQIRTVKFQTHQNGVNIPYHLKILLTL